MLDSGFMPPFHPRSSDIHVHGGGSDVSTREKTTVFSPTDEDYFLQRIDFNAFVCCTQAITSLLQLNTR